ncbi:MAG: anthranilate phosphoribosyltransferase [bacterium]
MSEENRKIGYAIKKIIDNHSLNEKEAYEVCMEIMEGNATPAQIGSLLTALRMKGETVDEITGFCRAMREKMISIKCAVEPLIDTCGTGGDGMNTFNISTTSAFIAAGAGCFVAKHGNRAVSSLCGSADLISSLGVKLDINYKLVKECIEKIGIGFLFAPLFHPAMKNAIGPRKEIGIRTIFNILGPLCNPAFVEYQVVGVCRKGLLEKIAQTLINLGVRQALIVYGCDGIDEITTTARTYVLEIKDKDEVEYEISPEDFGMKRCSMEELVVKNDKENLDSFISILKGCPGPKTDTALLNAGAAIYVAGKANTIKQGVEMARESIFSGSALNKLEEFRRFVNEYAKGDN